MEWLIIVTILTGVMYYLEKKWELGFHFFVITLVIGLGLYLGREFVDPYETYLRVGWMSFVGSATAFGALVGIVVVMITDPWKPPTQNK